MTQEITGWQWHHRWTIRKSFAHRCREITAHLITQVFTGRMLFLMPSQQCQSTEGSAYAVNLGSTQTRHRSTAGVGTQRNYVWLWVNCRYK